MPAVSTIFATTFLTTFSRDGPPSTSSASEFIPSTPTTTSTSSATSTTSTTSTPAPTSTSTPPPVPASSDTSTSTTSQAVQTTPSDSTSTFTSATSSPTPSRASPSPSAALRQTGSTSVFSTSSAISPAPSVNNTTTPSSTSPRVPSNRHAHPKWMGPLVGAVLATVLLAGLGLFCYTRRRRRRSAAPSTMLNPSDEPSTMAAQSTPGPYSMAPEEHAPSVVSFSVPVSTTGTLAHGITTDEEMHASLATTPTSEKLGHRSDDSRACDERAVSLGPEANQGEVADVRDVESSSNYDEPRSVVDERTGESEWRGEVARLMAQMSQLLQQRGRERSRINEESTRMRTPPPEYS